MKPTNCSQTSVFPTASPRPNRLAQMVLLAVAAVMGLTVFSGVLYIILAKLDTQQRSQPSTVESTQPESTQPKRPQDDPTIPTVESTPPTQDSLAEASAKMQLDRARRLAKVDRFEDAIAEANKIPVSSLIYQEAQQSVNQWSEQAQQKEAAQRAIQQSNQQHLQSAQQALDQDDWKTALQEVNQINVSSTNQNPFWQQQKDSIVQKIEPYQHEHKAREFLDKDELRNAFNEANQLPSIAPWSEKRAIILEKIGQRLADKKVAEKWNTRCRTLTQDNMSRCPSLDELKELVDLLPSARWIPGLNSPGRKARH